ncbi:MAG: YdcF family protein [Gemmatimonadetes bacterium]|nr:YdcF family protein [Gemmatimonadota bacterium]
MNRVLVLALAGLASFALLWVASIGAVWVAGRRPALRTADAIIVLGAAQYNGRPSPVLKARLDHALDLFRRRLGGRLILTGGVGQGDSLSEGEVARRYAIENGVPDSLILVDRAGETSAESVEAAAALMREAGLGSALIVSDSYHMLRLELLARRAGIRPFRAPAPDAPIERDAATFRRYLLRESLLLPAAAVLGGR